LSLDEINQFIRSNYYQAPYPKANKNDTELLLSSKKGVCWYRGHFKDDLSQEEVEVGLNKFDAKAIVVGHTLQSKIKRHYNGNVYGIDVKRPKDYHKNWPNQESEALLIENDMYFRVLNNGEVIKLE
jgi:hypothetical protein